ncbi:hypothetical protein Gohar_003970, partial [Gossypium harknessii]|nr:hypothetical protein [Gossypium harknessii]
MACLTSHLTVSVRACCELSHEGIGIGIDREEWKRWVMHVDFRSAKGENDSTLYLKGHGLALLSVTSELRESNISLSCGGQR